jgi:hypothetical protein
MGGEALDQWGSRDDNAADMRVLRRAIGIYTASQAALSFEHVIDDRLDRILEFSIKLKSEDRAHQAGFLVHEMEARVQDFVKDNRRLSRAIVLSNVGRYILEDPGLTPLVANPALFTRTMREMAAPEPSDTVTEALRVAGEETVMLREVMDSRSKNGSSAPAPESYEAVTEALRVVGKETALLRDVMCSQSKDASPNSDATTTPGAGSSDQIPSTASVTAPQATTARRPR